MNNEQLQSAQDALAQGMPQATMPQATQQVTMAGADQPAPVPEATPAPEAPAEATPTETPAETPTEAPTDATADTATDTADSKQGTLEERVARLEKDITALVQLFQQHEGTLRAQDAGLFLALYNLENESVLDVPTDIKTKQDILELGFGVKIRETMDVISKVTGTDKDDKEADTTSDTTADTTTPTDTSTEAPAEAPTDTTTPVDTTTPSAPDDVVTMNSEPSATTTMES